MAAGVYIVCQQHLLTKHRVFIHVYVSVLSYILLRMDFSGLFMSCVQAIGSQTSVNEQAVPCTPCAKTSVLQGIETGLHVDSQDRPAQAQKSDKYKAGRQRHRRLQRLAAKAMGRKRFLSHLAALPVTSAEDFEVPCPGMPVDGHSGSHARPLGVSRVAGRSSRRQPRHAVCDGHEGPASVFEDSRQGESPSQSDNPWKQIPGLL